MWYTMSNWLALYRMANFEDEDNPCWRHQMETFSALLAICVGTSPVTDEFSAQKKQWRGALMFSLMCAWINGWVNDGEVGDLRRQRVTVMHILKQNLSSLWRDNLLYALILITWTFLMNLWER